MVEVVGLFHGDSWGLAEFIGFFKFKKKLKFPSTKVASVKEPQSTLALRRE